MNNFTGYTDGNFGSSLRIYPSQPTFPFANNPTSDKYDRDILTACVVEAAQYVPNQWARTSVTNQILRSEAINAWTLTAVTVGPGEANPSDGLLTALPIYETTANSAHSVACTAATIDGAMVLSVYAAKGSRSWIQLVLADGTTTGSAFFDLASGRAGTASNATASITSVGFGFFRCSITFTTVANAASAVTVKLSTDGSTVSYTGTAGYGATLWGAQLETGLNASAYCYTGGAARTALFPEYSTTIDPFAFLTEESPLSVEANGIATFSRLYCRIPKAQTIPSSIGITKPVPSNGTTFPQINGSYMVNQPDATVTKYDAYKRVAVTSDTGAPGFYPTSGTYTLSFTGQTTGALNYNDSAGTVQTALNALSKVSDRGNVTVGGSYNSSGGLTVTFADIGTGSATSSLTATGAITTTVTASNNGYSQAVSFAPAYAYTSSTADGAGLTLSTDAGRQYLATQNGSNIFGFIIHSYFATYSVTGGTYSITVNGSTISNIPYNATFADIQNLINALGIGVFTVSAYDPNQFSQSEAYFYWTANSQWAICFRVTMIGGKVSAGTFTVTVLTQTTSAIAYNASAATIAAAINALANVTTRGGITITGDGLNASSTRIDFTFSFANGAVTGTSSLAPTTTINNALTNSGRTHAITFLSDSAIRTIVAANHMAVDGDMVYIFVTPTYYFGITNYFVVDQNTIRLLPKAADTWAAAGAITYAGGRTKAGYQPGGTVVRCEKVTNFYLPGVTYGVDVAADIPIAQNQSDQASFLEAAYSGTGVINYVVGELQSYSGPILQQTATQINVIDI